MKRTPSEGYNEYQMRAYAQFGVLISLFIDPDNPDDFIAGYVQSLTSRQVMLSAISTYGRFDGFITVRLSDIQMVLGEDDYALRLKMLLLARGEDRPGFHAEEDEDLMHAVCRWALEHHEVVTLWTKDNEYCGMVKALDDMRVTLDSLDYFGQNPITETVVLREVQMASSGTEDDRMFTLLHQKGGEVLSHS